MHAKPSWCTDTDYGCEYENILDRKLGESNRNRNVNRVVIVLFSKGSTPGDVTQIVGKNWSCTNRTLQNLGLTGIPLNYCYRCSRTRTRIIPFAACLGLPKIFRYEEAPCSPVLLIFSQNRRCSQTHQRSSDSTQEKNIWDENCEEDSRHA